MSPLSRGSSSSGGRTPVRDEQKADSGSPEGRTRTNNAVRQRFDGRPHPDKGLGLPFTCRAQRGHGPETLPTNSIFGERDPGIIDENGPCAPSSACTGPHWTPLGNWRLFGSIWGAAIAPLTKSPYFLTKISNFFTKIREKIDQNSKF